MTHQTALPAAIQRQLDEAAVIEQQVYGVQAPDAGNTGATPAEPPTEVVAPPVEAVVVQPEPATPSDEDTFRIRYTVLQGKYDAEVPRLHAQLREANANIQRAFAEIERLRTEPPRQPEPQVPDNVGAEDSERFGEDLTSAMDRRARKMAESIFAEQSAPLKAYIHQLEARLGETTAQVETTAQGRFYENLAKLVPDYEAVNSDPGFLNWLGGVDPVYGVTRQAALDHASGQLDAGRTANVFAAYKQLTGKQVSAPQPNVRRELERQVTPNSTPRAPAPQPTGKVWTSSEFEHALDPRRIRDLGAEAAANLAAEANAAYAEGRVRW